MGWMPGVRIAPIPASNFGHDGRPKIGVSAHHMDSSFASADGWFHNPIAQASAHFGVTYDGQITQWVDVDDVAYAQCLGNWQGWVTVENESDPDRPNDGPTLAQIAAMGRIIRWVGTPAVPATSPRSGGVGYHRQFGGPCAEAWGQTACPGDGFVAAIPAICAAARGEGDDFLMGLTDAEQREILDYTRQLRDGTKYSKPLLVTLAEIRTNVGDVAKQYGVEPVTVTVGKIRNSVKAIADKLGVKS